MRNQDISLVQKVHRAVNNYNNRYHSTLKMSPEEAMYADVATLVRQIRLEKEKRTQKLNQCREEYKEIREVIPVKNYKRNYYKNEPRYRIKKREKEHPINIKRPRLFADDDINVLDTRDNDGTDHSDIDN